MTTDLRINFPCRAGWIELKGYVNSGNKQSTMTLTVEYDTTIEIRAVDFTRTVDETSIEVAASLKRETTVGAKYDVVEASSTTGIEFSASMKKLLSLTKEVTRESDIKQSTAIKEQFEIGPGDQMYFYQRVLKGPGIYSTLKDTRVTTDPNLADEWTDVTLDMITRPISFIGTCNVRYGENEGDAPRMFVREVSGLSADINKGHKGKYVWLEPVYTYNSAEAATSFDILIQEKEKPGWYDLAKGTGGNYRYLRRNKGEPGLGLCIDVKLVRSSEKKTVQDIQATLGKNWTITRDINEGRKGDYLYLAYKRL